MPSPYVFLLNNDVELAPDYLGSLLRALESNEKLGFATGKLLRASDRARLDGAVDAMLLAGASYRLGHLDADEGQFDKPMPLVSACRAAVLYRSKAFLLCAHWMPTSLLISTTLTLACAPTSSDTVAFMSRRLRHTTSAALR